MSDSGAGHSGDGLSLAIADADSGEALGTVLLLLNPRTSRGPRPRSAEIGYWLIPRARGSRLASRAVALLAPWALTEAGLARVEALVDQDNTPSQHVLESVGFQREGHLRSYLVFGERRADTLIYSLLPSDLG